MWVLRVQFGGRSIRVPVAKPLLVGRSPDCDVIVHAPGVSRRHCSVEPAASGEGLWIRDLGSSLGLFLGDQPVQEALLAEGDAVAVGRAWLFVQRDATLDWRDATGCLVRFPVTLEGKEFPADSEVPLRETVPLERLDEALDALASAPDWGRRWAATLGVEDLEITLETALGERCLWPFTRDAAPASGRESLEGRAGRWTARWAGAPRAGGRSLLKALLRILDLAEGLPSRREAPPPSTPGDPPPPPVLGLTGAWEQVERLLDSDLPILITGETGVGKEVLARAVHAASRHSRGPFEPVHCSALPAELFESELFGIEEATATGVAGRPGRFLAARGGTLFLDEVAEIPLAFQAKLLRVLEEGAIWPVGGRRPIPLSVRIVSATHRDLAEAVARGTFREDLLYRLKGVEVRVPPLRERTADIPVLSRLFLEELEAELGKGISGISTEAFRRLVAYRWPGNVRELKMEIKRAYFQADPGGPIQSVHLSEAVRQAAPSGPSLSAPLARSRQAAVEQAVKRAMREAGGRVGQAAEALGITRQALSRHLRILGLKAADFRPGSPPEKT